MSRSFGSWNEYIFLAPIAEMFNHESTNVFFNFTNEKLCYFK